MNVSIEAPHDALWLAAAGMRATDHIRRAGTDHMFVASDQVSVPTLYVEGARSVDSLPTFWIPVDSGRKSTDGTFAPLAGRKSTELPYRSPSVRASESIV